MKNGGQITVFLCLVLLSILLLGFTALEIVRVKTGSARAAIAADGAVHSVMAAYNKPLFQEYHLLAVDRELQGQGEGKLEQMAQDYMDYTLDGQLEGLSAEQVELAGYKGLLDDDCDNMKLQISDYMQMYIQMEGARDLLEMLTVEDESEKKAVTAIDSGAGEEGDSDSLWLGTDPRDVMDRLRSGGILMLVTPGGKEPSAAEFDMAGLPSADRDNHDSEMEDIQFDDIETFRRQIQLDDHDSKAGLTDNFYGICYALQTFGYYTSPVDNRPMSCEVEYMIAGKDNDRDNLKGVVNRIIVHRLPVNMAYLLTDKSKVATVEAIAFVLSLLPGVTYSATKYLLLGCWAYAETLADIRIMLAGNNIQMFKDSDTWMTDIENLQDLINLDNVGYEGADAIGYKGYLALLLAENAGNMYYRMADLVQLNISRSDETFDMKNMVYEISMDVEVAQSEKFAAFIRDMGGQDVDSNMYRHSFRVTAGY